MLLLVLLALTWGSSYILIKKTLIALEPLEVAVLRMAVASIVLAPFCIRGIRRIP